MDRISSLVERLRPVGCERDQAGNRKLFFDQYCSLILLYLFNPSIASAAVSSVADAHDPPYPPELETARKTVKAACDKNGLAFLSSWHDPNKTEQENVQYLFDWGVKVISCRTEETKEVGLRLRPR